MRVSQAFRTAAIALIALIGASVSSIALADEGTIRITVYKAGWFLGGSGGDGVLTYKGKQYPLSIGGVSAGLVFGASKTRFNGTVRRINRPSDVEGVYGAGGAGAALGRGAGTIVLRNEKGAVLRMSGRQVGLEANIDLSGMVISLR